VSIQFRSLTKKDLPIIFQWIKEPHVREFWDNSQAHCDDIINFIDCRIKPSSYANGMYVYWIALDDDVPYALLMTIKESIAEDIKQIKLNNLSKTGTSYGIDYMIGNKAYLGRGLGATTLAQFINFFRTEIDPIADTFFIDPAADNPKAKHVFMNAGFDYIDDFIMSGKVSKRGKKHHLLMKRFNPIIKIVAASLEDYSLIQNMARFYVYDISRYCGNISAGWALPNDGLYESFDFKNYFEDPSRKAFRITVNQEQAGFILLNQVVIFSDSKWNVDEFFIIAKFQRCGIGRQVATMLWDMYSGSWEVSVIPENKPAVLFWTKTISNYTQNEFLREIITVPFDKEQPKRILFRFNTKRSIANAKIP